MYVFLKLRGSAVRLIAPNMTACQELAATLLKSGYAKVTITILMIAYRYLNLRLREVQEVLLVP